PPLEKEERWGSGGRRGWCEEIPAKERPGVLQVEGERQPPDDIVGDAEEGRGGRPVAAEDQDREAERSEDLAGQADGREEEAALRDARHLEVEHAVEADHHREAGEDRRMVERRHAGESERPLRIERREDPPGDVVDAGREERDAVEPAAREHGLYALPHSDRRATIGWMRAARLAGT